VPLSSASVTPTKILIHPKTLRPFGHLEARKEGFTKRKKGKSEIYTDTPVKKRMEEKKHSTRKRKKPATKRLMKFHTKNMIPEPDSSSEVGVGLDETTLCGTLK